MSHGEEPLNPESPEVAFEQRDVKWRPVLALLGSVAAVLIGLHVLVTIMFGVMTRSTRYTTEPFGKRAPQAVQQLQALRLHEDQILNSYGWVSRENRIVRIPIDRAMDLTVAEYGGKTP